MGEHAGLARARAGDDEQRPVDVENGLALGRVQVGEEIIVGCDGHASDASGPPRGADRSAGTDEPGFGQALSRTTMPSSSLVSIGAGRNVMPPNSTGTSISPTPSLALGRGTRAERLDPDRKLPERGDVAHAGVEDDPGPAVRRPRDRRPCRRGGRRERAAAVDDENPTVARPFDRRRSTTLSSRQRTVASGPLNDAIPPNWRNAQRADARVSDARRRGRRSRSPAEDTRCHQRTVSSRFAGCGVVPAKTTRNVYAPAGSDS